MVNKYRQIPTQLIYTLSHIDDITRLWENIDELVDFADCDVYNYQPEVDDDPNADDEGYM